jgi:RHS repeat-associated protein
MSTQNSFNTHIFKRLTCLLLALLFLLPTGNPLFAENGANNPCEDDLVDLPPEEEFSGNVTEVGSPKYRKIALNGRPLSDEKPQSKSETDQLDDDTYVDALNLQLSHRVTDVYVPLPGGDLSLMVRRNVKPEFFTSSSDQAIEELQENAFGVCWSSSIGAHILRSQTRRFVPFLDPEGEPLDDGEYKIDRLKYTVVDETGARHEFVASWQITGSGPVAAQFIPLPSSANDQDSFQNSLKVDPSNSDYMIFQRKHGVSLRFKHVRSLEIPTAHAEDNEILDIDDNGDLEEGELPDCDEDDADDGEGDGRDDEEDPDVLDPEDPAPYIRDLDYYRLESVTDRYNESDDPNAPTATAIFYRYNADNETILPNQIVARHANGNESQKILISYVDGPLGRQLVGSVTDPNGNVTTYSYSGAELTTVTHPAVGTPAVNPVTRYTYKTDARLSPNLDFDGLGRPDTITHINLETIQDPNGNVTTFQYVDDTSKISYKPDEGFFHDASGSKRLSIVNLPGGVTSTYTDYSLISAVGTPTGGSRFFGRRVTFVVDAEGNSRIYEFLGNKVTLMTDHTAVPNEKGQFHFPWLVYFDQMKISHLKGSAVTFTPTNEAININYNSADLLGVETYEFDLNAALALKKSTDFFGNTTEFFYEDSFTAPYMALIGGYDGLALKHPDPTRQVNAQGKTKKFSYDSNWRIMKTMVDELGRLTETPVDNLGRRTSESIYNNEAKSRLLQSTVFEYANPTFPAFTTKQTLKRNSSDPTSIVDLVTQRAPDSLGRLQTETKNPGGLNIINSFTYDLNNNKLTMVDGKSLTTTFQYDARNQLRAVLFPALPSGTVFTKSFDYDLRGNKTRETDQNGNSTLFAYDGLSRLQKQARDMNGNLTIDGEDLVTEFTYNLVNSKLTSKDPNGKVTYMDYDQLQRLVRTTDADGNINTFEYGHNSGATSFDVTSFKPTKTTDPRGFVRTVFYDQLYRSTTNIVQYQLSPLLNSTNITVYDFVGNVTSTKDPVGNVTQMKYDAMNRVVTNINADASFNFCKYSGTGFKFQNTDELGRVTDMVYDAVGRLSEVHQPLVDNGTGVQARPITKNFYDANNNLTATENPRGLRWDYVYDNLNRKFSETGPSVFDFDSSSNKRPVTKFYPDGVGNMTSVRNPKNFATSNHFDRANRMIMSSKPSLTGSGLGPTTLIRYDKNGNTTNVVDAVGRNTFNYFDSLNRMTNTTDAQGIKVFFTYDQVGNRLTVKDGRNKVTLFAYDGLNRNTKITDPFNKSEIFEFDGLNKRKRTDSNSKVTTYDYDNRNRLKFLKYVSRPADDREYIYDTVNNLLEVKEPGKSGKADVLYTYDALNRVSTEKSAGVTHQYKYDLAGNRVNTVYDTASPDMTITSTFDGLNRLDVMTEGIRTTTYRYDLNGNIRQKLYKSGTTTVSTTGQTFDRNDRLHTCQEKKGSGAVISTFTNAYTFVSAVTNVFETYGAGTIQQRNVKMEYDSIDRLRFETETVGTTAPLVTEYQYDAANNRTKKIKGAVTTTYSYSSLNTLNSFNDGTKTVSFTYDSNGNRTRWIEPAAGGGGVLTTNTYSYDGENRLIQYKKGTAGPTYNYVYDYRTRRVERKEGSTTTKVVYSGGTSVQEIDGTATSPTVQFVRGSDFGGGVGGILYSMRAGNPSFNYYNRRGDVVTKLSAGGTVTWQASYEAFGKRTQEFGTNLDRQRANSKDEDPSGLLNEGFRYRCLETGIFITRDPLGFIDGPNLYTYVGQSPWTSWDPDGLAKRSKDTPSDEEITKKISLLDKEIQGKQKEIDQLRSAGTNAPKATGFDSEKKAQELENTASKLRAEKDFLVKVIEVRGRLGENGYGEWTTHSAIAQSFGQFYGDEVRQWFTPEGGYLNPESRRGMMDMVTKGISMEVAAMGMFIPGPGPKGVANPIPGTVARVVPGHVSPKMLGKPGDADVFVTAASDIAGLNAAQIAKKLSIPPSRSGFKVIEFPTPSGIASPVNRSNPGFVGRGRTAGDAREFVIPNQAIPPDANIRTVQ